MPELSVATIMGYAAVDAVNPCALAVLTLILIAILTQHPEKRRMVLYAGLAFTTAIYITYFLYGLIIVQFFKVVTEFTSAAYPFLFNLLGVFAIILGLLNLKDSIRYKPGGIATEMPMSMRPKVKKLINTATSVKGAFVIGVFVTLFLLPCTIGLILSQEVFCLR